MARPPKVTADSGLFGQVPGSQFGPEPQAISLTPEAVFTSWRAYATAVGQSAPYNVNRATASIRRIPGVGR